MLVRKPAHVMSQKPFCDLLWSCTLSTTLCSIPLGSSGACNGQRRQFWWLWIKEAVIRTCWRRLVVCNSTNCGGEQPETSSWFGEDSIILDQNVPQFDFLQVSYLWHTQTIALVKHCSGKLQINQTKITDNCALVDELLATQWACFVDKTSLKCHIHFGFILKQMIFLCKQLKRPAAFGADQTDRQIMLNSKEWLICDKLLQLFLRLVFWK